MTQNPHHFLSELHRLLSETDLTTVQDAYAIARGASYARIIEAIMFELGGAADAAVSSPPLEGEKQDVPDDEAEDLQALLLSDSASIRGSMLHKMLEDVGLQISYRAKDGRRRLADKAVKALLKIPKNRRRAVVKKLRVALSQSQTVGWRKAIREAQGP